MLKVTWPNRITITRILLIGPFVIALLKLQTEWGETARWAALGVFALASIGDGIDGYLARRLHEESAVGRFLDPLADYLLIVLSVPILAHEGTHIDGARIPATVAVIAIGKQLIVLLGFFLIYFATTEIHVEPRRIGKWCMSMQMTTVIAVLLSPSLPQPLRYYVPRVVWWTASGLAVAAVIDYFQAARAFLARHEPPPSPPGPNPAGETR